MKVALVHQVRADLLAHVAFKQHVVGQHHRRPAAWFQGSVDVLQEAELLVAGGKGEILAARQAAALLGAEGWIRKDQCGRWQCLRVAAERVAIPDAAFARP